MFQGINKVMIDVEDQERAKQFWIETMGCSLVQDTPYGDERWLEVRTPDQNSVLVLGMRHGPRHDDGGDDVPSSPIFLACDDLEQSYRDMTDRGVVFSQPPVQLPFGWWSMFNDTEGNRFALVPRDQ